MGTRISHDSHARASEPDSYCAACAVPADACRCRSEARTVVVKTCACGYVFTLADWEELPFVGEIEVPADDVGPRTVTSLRNCPCGSTIGLDTEFP